MKSVGNRWMKHVMAMFMAIAVAVTSLPMTMLVQAEENSDMIERARVSGEDSSEKANIQSSAAEAADNGAAVTETTDIAPIAAQTADDGTPAAETTNIAPKATATAAIDLVNDGGGVAVLNNGVEPQSSTNGTENAISIKDAWHTWGMEGQQVYA